jgi:hypothetical protein
MPDIPTKKPEQKLLPPAKEIFLPNSSKQDQINTALAISQPKNTTFTTLLPGQIVQVPPIPQSQISNPENLSNQANAPVLEGKDLQDELTKVQTELANLKSQMANLQQNGELPPKTPENIQETKEKGVGMLKGMKNWFKENKQIAGISQKAKEFGNWIKKPENAVLVAGLVAGGAVALPGILSAAGVGTIAGSVVGSFGGIGLAAMPTAVAQGVSAVSGSILAGSGLVASDLVKRGRNFLDNRNQTNQQSEMPPIQSNYENNPNRAILSSNLPNAQVDNFTNTQVDASTIPFGQENLQNIQSTESPNQNPALQNSQTQQIE